MPQTLEEFRAKFRVEELAVRANDGWTLSVRPAACTLGACVLSANRPLLSLGEVTPEEAADLAEMAGWFEARARAAFGADKFNHLALMMVDDRLHFHSLPRYAGERSFAGIAWTDPGWPKAPDLGHAHGAGDDALLAVRDALGGSRA